MKKRILSLILALAVLLMPMLFSGCGEEEEQGSPDDTQTVADDTPGFSQNKAALAGFGMGADTLEDISARFGEPENVTKNERHASTDIQADYPFGHFIFYGGKGETPVLTQVTINSQIEGPCGVTIGMSAFNAAEAVLPGAGDIIEDAGYTDVYLYQRGEGDYARFALLTAEYHTSASTDVSRITCSAPSYDDGVYIVFEMYFNSANELTSFVLSQG